MFKLKVIFFIFSLAFLPYQSLAKNNLIELTCFTEFLNDKPSQRKVPIFFAKINLSNNDIYWSDINKRIIEKDITPDNISVLAESGVEARKVLEINRINGSFFYAKPTLKADGSIAGIDFFEGICEFGIKKKLF